MINSALWRTGLRTQGGFQRIFCINWLVRCTDAAFAERQIALRYHLTMHRSGHNKGGYRVLEKSAATSTRESSLAKQSPCALHREWLTTHHVNFARILEPKPTSPDDVTSSLFQPLKHISSSDNPPEPPALTPESPLSRIRNQKLGWPPAPWLCMGAFPQHENAHKTDLICIESLESPCQGPQCNLFSRRHFQIVSTLASLDDEDKMNGKGDVHIVYNIYCKEWSYWTRRQKVFSVQIL